MEGWGKTVQHRWCDTLVISALVSKNKDIVRKNNSVAPTVLFSLTPAERNKKILHQKSEKSKIKPSYLKQFFETSCA